MTGRTGPQISAVMPTYNRAAVIRQAVESALGQTYAPSEVIVVDDGSEDDTSEQLGIFGTEIVVLRQGQRGPGAARNLGIRAAGGEWIAFLDSDDLWTPDHLDGLVETLGANPQLVWACSNACAQTPGADEAELASPEGEPQRACTPERLLESFFAAAARGFRFSTPGFMIRRDVLLSVGGFDEELQHGEDLDLWWRIARLHPAIGYDPSPTAVIRRITADRLTHRHWSADREICAVIERHLECLGSTPDGEDFRRVAGRILDLYGSRAIHLGDVDGLLEIDRRFGALLSVRRRLTARVLRLLPTPTHRAALVLARAPGRLAATVRAAHTRFTG